MQEKISISIDRNLLLRVDNLVDGHAIKKRSKAFEFVLDEYFKGLMVNNLVILGGSDVKIDDRAVLSNVKRLMNSGVKKVFIIGDNNFDILKNNFSKLGLEVGIIKEKTLLGTAGALKLIEGRINKPFLAIFINIKFDFDVAGMISLHKQNSSIATIGVTLARKNTIPNNIAVEGNKITSYNKRKNQFINAGIYLFEPKIFSYLPKKGTLDRDVFPKLAEQGKLYSYIITENWEYLGK